MRRAKWQAGPIPTVLDKQSYSSLPYDTHPIDLTNSPQGWGPFGAGGPFPQVEFVNPQMFLSTGYTGSNVWKNAPGYGISTLFDDPSLDRVDNMSFISSIRSALGDVQRGMSSTISNSPAVASTSSRILAALGLKRAGV